MKKSLSSSAHLSGEVDADESELGSLDRRCRRLDRSIITTTVVLVPKVWGIHRRKQRKVLEVWVSDDKQSGT